MNFGLWIGCLGAVAVVAWGLRQSGTSTAIFNAHGLMIVGFGTLAATLINCPLRQLWSALITLGGLFLPARLPSAEGVIAELSRLARQAQVEGGLLSLQEESRDFADGFLHRAVTVAITTGESGETRRILENEIRQTRISRQEDANVFRTIGVLSPMFGLLGTLLGMIRVLETMSEPTKVGPAMAIALSSAFFGIGLANFICIPVAGQIRLRSMRETQILEMILEGVLDLAAGKPPYLIEVHLSSYSQSRRREMEAAETQAARAPAPGGAP